MDAYDVCTNCDRHIKRSEVRCPFCAAAHHAASPQPQLPRMSRAQWLAFGGALALLGCSGAPQPPLSESTEAGTGEGGGQGQPFAPEANTTGRPPSIVVASRFAADIPPPNPCSVSGSFACGTSTCDRATQFCASTNDGPGWCVADDAGVQFPAQCQGCPTCDCIADAGLPPGCRCSDIDDGGGVGIACIACYGAPPVRLERIARAA